MAAELPMTLSDSSFRRLSAYVTRELGIQMNAEKVFMLQSRLMRRLRHLNMSDFDEYVEFLFDSPEAAAEQVHFLDAVTTNKTDFFREPEHFVILRRIASETSRIFRVWSAGSSTGEEAYTIAMTLHGMDYTVLGTDISSRALRHAHAAIYDMDRIAPIPQELRRSFLLRSKDPAARKVRVAADLRRRVSFQRLNFMADDYNVPGAYHAIFFRNVMIYFDRAIQEAVVGKLCTKLHAGGYLFCGHAESLAGMNLPLRQVAPAVFKRL